MHVHVYPPFWPRIRPAGRRTDAAEIAKGLWTAGDKPRISVKAFKIGKTIFIAGAASAFPHSIRAEFHRRHIASAFRSITGCALIDARPIVITPFLRIRF